MLLALLKASLVLGLVQLLALTRISAAMKHLLLTTAIAAFVLIPALTFFFPPLTIEVERPAVSREAAAAPAAVVAPEAGAAPPVVSRSAPPRFPIELLWPVGTLVVLARLVRSASRVRRIARRASAPSARLLALLDHPRIRLLVSEDVSVPMVWGLRSGTLLLPLVAEEWSDEELRTTFIHELGHLQRLDYLSLALMNLVSALLWFHPQVWLARRQALAAGERACDDLVLRAGERASAYASHLLNVARLAPRRDPLAALLAMSRPSQLEGRMLALLSPHTNHQPLGGKRLMISTATFLAVIVPFAVLHISAAPHDVPPVPPRPPAPAAPARVMAPPAPPAPHAPAPPHVAAPEAPEAPVALDVEAPEPPEPLADEPVPPAPPAPEVPPAPPAAEVPAAPAAPDAPPAPPAPYAEPIRAWSSDELGSRAYAVLGKLEARACTLRLLRPTNTGDPERNPAETRAMRRLLQDAAASGANGVTKVKCMREIAIGTVCPTAVICEGEAITLE